MAAQNANTEFEIIVIDDGSKDDSINFLKENYKNVKLLINDKNRGFSYTCNHGIREAKLIILAITPKVSALLKYFH